MNNEIKEILSYLKKKENTRRIKCITIEESKVLLNYITNLQQKYEEADYDRHKLFEENERLNNCIDDQERVINSLIDKRDLYKINYNDYKSRCEKGIEYIKENEFYLDYKTGACIKGVMPLLNILQNGSDEE